jgi:Rap1a immunity proteins
MKAKYAALLGVFCLWPASAFSGAFLTGNDLFSRCSTEGNNGEISCLGYIEGVADLMTALDKTCLSGNVTSRQATDIVMKYLRDHPESRHYSASSIAGLALQQAFPCAPK